MPERLCWPGSSPDRWAVSRLCAQHRARFSAFCCTPTSLVAQRVENPPANAGDTGDTSSIPGLGRFPGGGNGNPLHYSYLKNPTDTGAWRTTAQRVTKSRMQLSTHTRSMKWGLRTCPRGPGKAACRGRPGRKRPWHHTSVPGHGSTLCGLAGRPRVSCSQRHASPFLTALRGALLTQEEAFSSHFQFLLVSEGPHKTTCVDKATDSILHPSCPQVRVLKPTPQCDGVLRCSLWGGFRSWRQSPHEWE